MNGPSGCTNLLAFSLSQTSFAKKANGNRYRKARRRALMSIFCSPATRRRNMTAVVYAHKAGRGNGVGLHYSRFRPSWRFIIPPNQRLGLMPPAQNRHFPPRIREVGLNRVQFETRSTNLPRSPRGVKI